MDPREHPDKTVILPHRLLALWGCLEIRIRCEDVVRVRAGQEESKSAMRLALSHTFGDSGFPILGSHEAASSERL